jgi:Ni/Co efflux regulator RcnB
MKKLILGLVATTIVAAPLALATTPAEAALGDNHVITKTEFRAVKKGMSITRVNNIVDYQGSQSYYDGGYPGAYGWPASQSREYRQAGSKYGSAYIDFERHNGVWKVDSKSAYWF